MVGIVVASHSPRLAEAAVELALEMVVGDKPPIAIAAGAGDDVIGTDAARIAEGIAQVASERGVLVLMDLGSAILSAELAVELLDDPSPTVRLSSAPFFEGLQAAVVLAAAGASLEEVDSAATASLGAKKSQLGDPHPSPQPDSASATGDETSTGAAAHSDAPPDAAADVMLVNRDGLHARPVAAVVAAVADFDARVTMTNLRSGAGPVSARSPIGLAMLAASASDPVRVEGRGPDARAAVDAVLSLITSGFGETRVIGATTAPDVGARTARSNITAGARSQQAAVAPQRSVPTRRPVEIGAGAVGVSPGRVVGRAVVVAPPIAEPEAATELAITDRDAAADRADAAAVSVESDLNERASHVVAEAHDILAAIASIARDPELAASIRTGIIDRGLTPERSVWDAIAQLSAAYESGGPLLAARVVDLHAVRDRMIAHLSGQPAPGVPDLQSPSVLVAHDLAPTDTAVLDPSLCLAIVTQEGGPTSHTAILARSLGIPAVVAAHGATTIPDGATVLVDGTTGEIVVEPSDQQQAEVVSADPGPAVTGPGRTSDGHPVPLLVNIASADDVAGAHAADAEGVGLFRTEFCFLGRADAPGINEQIIAYRRVFAEFRGRKVVVRTLDAGADKPLPFVTTRGEPNPALGVRGYRTALVHPDVLDDQLAAIAEAADGLDVEAWVMAPMISTTDEAAAFAALCRQHRLARVGVMIETPAAALMAKEILAIVDFASLGTNDLVQYTMAADRMLGGLAPFNDPWQPSVLRLVRTVCEAGSAAGKPVGVCGEAAADPMLAIALVGLGVTSLSMTSRSRAAVSTRLRSVTIDTCRAVAEAACASSTSVAARERAAALLHSRTSAGRPPERR